MTTEKCILSWLPPLHDGGGKIEYYIIQRRETSRLTWTNVATDLQVNRYKVTKLLKGNEYIFRVMAVNKYGVGEPLESEPAVATNPYVPSDPPQAPEVSAITKDSMVVCWGHPEHNGGSSINTYIIERRDKTGLRWVKCNKRTVTDLRFKVSGLTPGHEYEYRILAENAAGLSAPSPSSPFYKACDTIFQPGPPGNPRVLDTTKSSITIAWNKPVYDGGSDITGYIVETCLPEEDEWTIVTPMAGLTATSFTITNLIENQEYKINISALNCEGVGEPASLPGSPKAEDRLLPPEIELDSDLRKVVNIRACSTLRLFVPIKGRPAPEVRWSRETGEPLDKASIEITSSFTTLVIENVNRFDGGKYMLTVENSSGTKTAFVNVRVLDTPDAPQNLTIKEITKDSASLIWDPPVIDGGSRIRHYIVEKRESTRKAYSIVNTSCPKTSCRIGDLQEGSLYFFRILAENEYGVGLPVETTEAIKISERPLPPGKVSLKEVTGNSVTLSWEKPDHDGGSRITGYIVEMQGKNSEKWTQVMTVKVTEAVVVGLTQGEEYSFRISATNEKGTSDPRPLSVPVVAMDVVIAPAFKLLFSTFSVLAGDDLKIDVPYVAQPKATVTWQKDGIALKETTRVNSEVAERHLYLVIKEATRDDVGKYTIKLTNLAGEATADINVIVLDKPGPPTGPIKIEEVTADSVTLSWQPPELEIKNTDFTTTLSVKEAIRVDGGQYTLLLKNVGGEKSVVVNVKVLDRPGPPDGPISIYGVTSEKCSIAWKTPLHDGGAEVSHYIVERRETSRLVWTVVESKVQTLNLKITKLLPGNEYIFRVIPVNKYGIGEPLESDPVIAANPFVPPDAPSNVEVSNITKDSMVITWERPTNDGGNAIAGYIVEKRDKEGVRWARCNKRVVSELRFRVTGLLENRSYEFRVSAENAAGVGKPSPPTVYFKAVDQVFKPGPPNNPKVIDVSRASVVLHWGKPIYDGGCEIQSYIVEACEVTSEEWMMCTPPSGITETRFEVKKLLEKHEYKFRICAINKVGVGETADVPGSIILEDKLEAPDIDLDADLRKMITVRAGGSLRLFVPIRGRPTPEVKWGKAEGEINEAAQIDITSSFTSLIIENVNRFDSGKYNLTLENASGTKSAFISVRVLDTPDAPANFRVKEITKNSVTLTWEPPLLDVKSLDTVITNLVQGGEYNFRVIAVNDKGKSDPRLLANPVVAKDLAIQPTVRTKLSTYNVQVGQDLKIEARISGHPKPTITWTKDGSVLKQTTRVNVADTAHHTTLTIKDATREDGGMYNIAVANVLGQAEATVEIIILEKPGT
uniref:Titin n=1 Tax=Cyprinus carpio TaxID=7962 RepID=A0A8C1S6F9_CYPCA